MFIDIRDFCILIIYLTIQRPPSLTRTDTPCPSTTLVRSHRIVGAGVKRSGALGVDLSELPAGEAAAFHAAVTPAALAALTVEASVASRISYGGTAPERVREAIRSEERRTGKECVRRCQYRWSPYL